MLTAATYYAGGLLGELAKLAVVSHANFLVISVCTCVLDPGPSGISIDACSVLLGVAAVMLQVHACLLFECQFPSQGALLIP